MSVNKYNPTTGELEVLAGGSTTLYADAPVGAIMPYGGTTAPDGFLLCQGQEVSKTTYSELYAVIGDSFKGAKADPASGNFYLPDLREVTLKGVGSNYAYAINNHGTIGNVGGFMEDRVQDHAHKTYINGDTGYEFGTKVGGETNINYTNADTQNGVGWNVKANTIYAGRHGATTEVKAVGVNYIIKATQVGVPVDFAPVDVVEDGNMKAVTSNAVAKITNHTNELVWNTEYIDLGSWSSGGLFERCGFVLLDKILILKANCPSGALLCTGFPRPIVGMEIPVSFDNAEMGGGLFLDTNGDLRAYATSNENNESFRVNFIYMKNL